MRVRELIAQLAQETDMDSEVYVRVVDHITGEDDFCGVDGIATHLNSYHLSDTVTCTTIVIGA